MGYEQDAADLIDRHGGDCEAAARDSTIHSNRAFRLYLLEIALQAISQKRRAMKRRELRSTFIKPDFVTGTRAGPKIVLTARSRRKLAEATIELFTGWKIGGMDLGDATKSDLERFEKTERSSANGHIKNAEFYKALRLPMNDKEKVKDYWKDEKAVKLIVNEIWEDKGKGGSGAGKDDSPTPPPPP